MIVKNPLYALLNRGKTGKKGALPLAYNTHTSEQLARILGGSSPFWQSFNAYAAIYETVSAVKTVIDIKADAAANVRFIVRDAKTQEIIPFNSSNKRANKLYRLMANPNPLDSTAEFFRANFVYHDVFGKSFNYASVPAGREKFVDLDNIDTLTALPANFMRTFYTGKFFDALTISDIIDHYEFFDGLTRKEFKPTTILQRRNVGMKIPSTSNNGDIKEDELSDLCSLKKEISNFILSLESRNVLSKKRGALGIFTSAMKMGGDMMPLSDNLKEDVQQAFEKYGTLEDQEMFIHTKAPLTFQRVALSTKELMLLEESWQDMIAIALKYGVPEVLVKLYIKGTTFENQNIAEKRLYQNTVKPRMRDLIKDISIFLKLDEFDLILEPSYDHVEVLQADRKDEAETKKIESEIARSLFLAGAYTYNDWLTKIGELPIKESWADKRIFDLEPEEIAIVLRQIPTVESVLKED